MAEGDAHAGSNRRRGVGLYEGRGFGYRWPLADHIEGATSVLMTKALCDKLLGHAAMPPLATGATCP